MTEHDLHVLLLGVIVGLVVGMAWMAALLQWVYRRLLLGQRHRGSWIPGRQPTP